MGEFTVNTRQFSAAIRNLLQKHVDVRHKAMQKAADIMRDEAKARCPFDEGILHGSILGDTEIYPKSEAAVVYVPVNSPASKYAIPMHEHTYNLGKGSIAHQAKTGCVVGPGYLTRAVVESFDRIMGNIVRLLRTELSNK